MLRQCFSFGGRLGRAGYNSLSLMAFVLIVVGQIIFVSPLFLSVPKGPVTFSSVPLGWNAVIGGGLGGIALLNCISVSVRRLHDLGRSGWWLLPCAVVLPLGNIALAVNAILLIFLSFFRGVKGSNEYGENSPSNMIA